MTSQNVALCASLANEADVKPTQILLGEKVLISFSLLPVFALHSAIVIGFSGLGRVPDNERLWAPYDTSGLDKPTIERKM